MKKTTNFLISKRTLNIWTKADKIFREQYILNKDIKTYYVNPNTIIDLTPQIYIPKHVQKFMDPCKTKSLLFIDAPNILPSIKKGLSGICQKGPIFYNEQSNGLVLTLMTLKFAVCLFMGKPINNKEDIVLKIELFLQKDSFIDTTLYYPLAQHIITNMLAHFKFSPYILDKLTNNLIDYTYYKNDFITTTPIVESVAFFSTLGSFLTKNKDFIKVTAQNPDNPLGDHDKYRTLSYSIGKQPYYDFVAHVCFNLETFKNKTLVYDVKLIENPLKFLSLMKGHLSLVTIMGDQNKMVFMKRLRGDTNGYLKNIKDLDIKTKQKLKEFNEDLNYTIENKNYTIDVKYQNVLKFIDNFDMNPQINGFVCSRIAETVLNTHFDTFYLQEYSNNENNILKISKEISMESLVPKTGQAANVEAWNNFVLIIINKMPCKIREEMLDNYHKFKLIENGIIS